MSAKDGHRWLTVLAVGGLVAGGLMAVFGLPPVDLHGPAHHLGIMSPTCGGTRSVWAAMRGDLAASWRYNPIGIPLVLGAVATLVRFAVGLVTGRWLNVFVRSWSALGMLGGIFVALLSLNQQLHADVLRVSGEGSAALGLFVNAALGLVVTALVVGIHYRAVRGSVDRSSE
ncbi:DUF2752 domain-containing protein [Salinactinospora qingdaonensis]|uniref:DUF2752 domain-containing protein n=1 Tax=Salinactinospora qingdaonensis TaxID=702744 RepID=UPI0031EF4061